MLAKSLGLIKQTNSQILEVLKSNSEVLARIKEDFHTMLRARGLKGERPTEITCCYEELPLPGVGEVSPWFLKFVWICLQSLLFSLGARFFASLVPFLAIALIHLSPSYVQMLTKWIIGCANELSNSTRICSYWNPRKSHGYDEICVGR